jgi:hypothetical protein
LAFPSVSQEEPSAPTACMSDLELIRWEAESNHLKQTAAELLDTNSRYAEMVAFLKADAAVQVARLEERLSAAADENQTLRLRMAEAGRQHSAELAAQAAEIAALRAAVGSLGKDASRSSDEQLATLADTNKALVNVVLEKDKLLRRQQEQLRQARAAAIAAATCGGGGGGGRAAECPPMVEAEPSARLRAGAVRNTVDEHSFRSGGDRQQWSGAAREQWISPFARTQVVDRQ